MVHAHFELLYLSIFKRYTYIAMKTKDMSGCAQNEKGSIDNDPSSAETNSVVQQAATKRPHSD